MATYNNQNEAYTILIHTYYIRVLENILHSRYESMAHAPRTLVAQHQLLPIFAFQQYRIEFF
jgi:hypothetical protein